MSEGELSSSASQLSLLNSHYVAVRNSNRIECHQFMACIRLDRTLQGGGS